MLFFNSRQLNRQDIPTAARADYLVAACLSHIILPIVALSDFTLEQVSVRMPDKHSQLTGKDIVSPLLVQPMLVVLIHDKNNYKPSQGSYCTVRMDLKF